MASIFGTDGIRDRFGHGWLQPRGIYAIGHAVAQQLKRQTSSPITIGIAGDTRASRAAIQSSLYRALTVYPIQIIDYGILPTPALVRILRDNEHTCGIMITASHNPAQDNGIKIFGPGGRKITQEEEAEISHTAYDAYHNIPTYENRSALHDHACGSMTHAHDHGHALYRNVLFQSCTPDLSGITIVIDGASGATHAIAPDILRAYGASVITIDQHPDGYNINDGCGSTQPHTLQHAVTHYNAHIGFAFDGDGDRVIAVNAHGEIKDGDDLLAILLQHPSYRATPSIVSTHMSNMGLEQLLEQCNTQVIRTRVGDKHVAAALHTHDLLLGGEPSGHIIMRDLHTTGDGIMTVLRVMEVLTHTQDWKLHSFEKYTQITYTIAVQQRIPVESAPLCDILNTAHSTIDGRIVARYSGTEPVMRIMVESKDHEQAQIVGYQLYNDISDIIGSPCKE